jgi:Flp pilus assembly protein TadG
MKPWLSGWLPRSVRRPLRAQRGQAMIMMAILLPVLVGFVGLVVDAGMLYVVKGRLQNSVDAAALAGAQGLPVAADAKAIACTYIDSNVVSNMTGATCGGKADVVTSGSGPDTITVTAHRSVPTTLMAVLGNVLPTNVGAQATVKIGSVGGKMCYFPLFIEKSNFDPNRPLYTPIGFTNHNSAQLEEGATGNKDVTVAMGDDCLTDKSFEATAGDELNIKPGSPSQWRSGWDDLLLKATASGSACKSSNLLNYVVKDSNGNDKLDPSLNMVNCPRLLMVPVTEVLPNGKGRILGFTPFFFSAICDQTTCSNPVPLVKHEAWGYYLNMEFVGGLYTNYNSYGTKVIVMTE